PRPGFRLLGPAEVLTPPRDGSSLDPHEVEARLLEVHKRNPVHTVVMDMSKAEQLAEWIKEEIGAEVVDHGTGNTAAVLDYDRFMEALRNGWLKHTGAPALARHVLTAVARMLPGGETRFDRPSQTRHGAQQERRVIDALTAASGVHAIAAVNADYDVLDSVR